MANLLMQRDRELPLLERIPTQKDHRLLLKVMDLMQKELEH